MDFNYYLVELRSGWYIVRAASKTIARRDAVANDGRNNIVKIEIASPSDIRYYLALKGQIETL